LQPSVSNSLIKYRRFRWARNMTNLGGRGGRRNKNVYTILVRKSEGKRQLGRHRRRGKH